MLGWPHDQIIPNNLPYTVLGAGVLWFRWFGFNAGSALSAGGLASSAFAATHIAAATATVTWALAEYLQHGKASVLGAASGSVAGLVAITPAAGYVGPMSALLIGGIAGVLCYFAVSIKFAFRYDDALDVVGVHGVGGTWGAVATGLWASAAVNPAAFKTGGGAAVSQGLFISGQWGLLGYQVLAVLTTYVLAVVGCLVCLGIAGAVTGGLRVNEDDEFSGLDLSQHSENAYLFATGGYGASSAFGARPVEHRAAAHARAAD